LFLGGVQWAILRRYLPRAGRWLLATAAGWLGGFAAIYLLAILGRRYPQTLPQEWQLELILPLLGLCVSIAQWLALRHDVRRAGWLVLANVIAFAAIRLITGGSFDFVDSLTLALLPAINTGLVIIWLLCCGNSYGAGDQEPKDTGRASASRSADASWLATTPPRKSIRLALLLLWILAILGPWTYTLDGVPPAEWCDERYVLIAEDRCADLVSGLAMLAWMPLMAASAVAELFSDGFVVLGRILPVAAIYALMLLPLVSSLLLLVRGDSPRRQRVHLGIMLFAVPVGGRLPFLLNGAYGMVISLRLWGLWLFVVVCAVALLFELLISWRRPPFPPQRLAPPNPAA